MARRPNLQTAEQPPAKPEATVIQFRGAPSSSTSSSGDDQDVMVDGDLSVIKCVEEFYREAESARHERIKKNQSNTSVYMSEQDTSNKIPGQSAEFLPKVSVAAEQFSAFVKRSLVAFGKWFQIDKRQYAPANQFLQDWQVEDIVDYFLGILPDGKNKTIKFGVRLGDGMKVAALECLCILKVYGELVKVREYSVGSIDTQALAKSVGGPQAIGQNDLGSGDIPTSAIPSMPGQAPPPPGGGQSTSPIQLTSPSSPTPPVPPTPPSGVEEEGPSEPDQMSEESQAENLQTLHGVIRAAGPQLSVKEKEVWKLQIELIPPEDYYPDPSGKGLYEIHESEQDLSYVIDRAASGYYDKSAVAKLVQDMQRSEDQKRKDYLRGQHRASKPSFRKKVVLREFWGDLLDRDGQVKYRNCKCVVANEKYLIRKPTDNPFWHGESPFVVFPLLRVPFSTWHKALYDDASGLNLALNELFNLMLDGGLGAVWGTRQIRVDQLENPGEISNGIPYGKTLVVKDSLPAGEKVLETIVTGNVPPEALAMFNIVTGEFTSSALSNELKLGDLPNKQVKATEVVEMQQSQGVTIDAIASDCESGIAEILRKSWLCILQDFDILDHDDLMNIIGPAASIALYKLSPAERFALLAKRSVFKVDGLSATLSRARDFQKIAAYLQVVGQNPLLLRNFIQKYSADKLNQTIQKSLNLNPEDLEKTPEELAQVQAEMAFAQQMGGGAGKMTNPSSGVAAAPTGGPELPAQINQATNPISGIGATA